MKSIKQLSRNCGQRFAFLTTERGLQCVGDKIEDWGFEKCYKGDQVGVILCFEIREFYLFVKVVRLVNDEFPKSIGEVFADSDLNTFDLDDVVTLRARQSLIPQYASGTNLDSELFDRVIDKQAENLRLFAGDILDGDFSSFVELEKIVKARARDAAIRKWGSRAIEFGWKL